MAALVRRETRVLILPSRCRPHTSNALLLLYELESEGICVKEPAKMCVIRYSGG